jgi:hypothetical protein
MAALSYLSAVSLTPVNSLSLVSLIPLININSRILASDSLLRPLWSFVRHRSSNSHRTLTFLVDLNPQHCEKSAKKRCQDSDYSGLQDALVNHNISMFCPGNVFSKIRPLIKGEWLSNPLTMTRSICRQIPTHCWTFPLIRA